MKSWQITCLASFMLCGCATSYQSQGLTGGFQNQAGPGKLEYVYFSGNGYISAKTVQDYALYRAAEISQSKKSPYFLIYDSLRAAAIDHPDNMPRVGIIQGKPIASTFVLPLNEARYGAKETTVVLRELNSVVHPQDAQSK